MQAITMEDADTGLSRYLDAIAHGESFVITMHNKAVAKLVPIDELCAEKLPGAGRPKVGAIVDHSVEIRDDAFQSLTDDELKEWGL
jgi:antitoxin (DNA-binding transcriptional repressor) of toxin-antitoxin stability system